MPPVFMTTGQWDLCFGRIGRCIHHYYQLEAIESTTLPGQATDIREQYHFTSNGDEFAIAPEGGPSLDNGLIDSYIGKRNNVVSWKADLVSLAADTINAAEERIRLNGGPDTFEAAMSLDGLSVNKIEQTFNASKSFPQRVAFTGYGHLAVHDKTIDEQLNVVDAQNMINDKLRFEVVNAVGNGAVRGGETLRIRGMDVADNAASGGRDNYGAGQGPDLQGVLGISLLANGSFEVWDNATNAENWTHAGTTGSGTERNTANKVIGTAAIKFTGIPGIRTSYIEQNVSLDVRRGYWMGARFQRESTAGTKGRIVMQLLNSDGTEITSFNTAITSVDTNSFELISKWFELDDNDYDPDGYKFRINIKTNWDTGYVFCDMAGIVESVQFNGLQFAYWPGTAANVLSSAQFYVCNENAVTSADTDFKRYFQRFNIHQLERPMLPAAAAGTYGFTQVTNV